MSDSKEEVYRRLAIELAFALDNVVRVHEAAKSLRKSNGDDFWIDRMRDSSIDVADVLTDRAHKVLELER